MPKKPQVIKKSPLHPSALRIQDLTPGRTIVRVNIYSNYHGVYVVLDRPVVVPNPYSGGFKLKVKLKDHRGHIDTHFLGDMGVISYGKSWNKLNYTIDARKQHLIPPAIPDTRPLDTMDDYFGGYDTLYDSYVLGGRDEGAYDRRFASRYPQPRALMYKTPPDH